MNIQLAEMLMSRMAHELAGPISAIANGVEFMQEVEDAADDAIELIGNSAQRAASRLQFYRVAYGGAGRATSDENVIRDTARAFVEDSGLELVWPDDAVSSLLSRAGGGKLVLTAIEIVGGALLRGGEVRVAGAPGGAVVEAEGPKPTIPQEVRDRLMAGASAGNDEITARSVHCLYLHLLADGAGKKVGFTEQPNAIRLTIQ